MTLHHLPQRTHPLGFDWLIPREGIDEGYLVETRSVSRHHTTTKVDTLSSTRFHSTRVTPPLLFLLGTPTCATCTPTVRSATCTITARSTTASPLTEANTFPARARTFTPELLQRVHSPCSCTWPILPSRQL